MAATSTPLVLTVQVGKEKKNTMPLDPHTTTLALLKEVIQRLTNIPVHGQKITSRRCTTLMKKKDSELLSEIFKKDKKVGSTSSSDSVVEGGRSELALKDGDVLLVTGTPMDERDLGTRADFDPHRPMLAGSGNFQMKGQIEIVNRLGTWIWVQEGKNVFKGIIAPEGVSSFGGVPPPPLPYPPLDGEDEGEAEEEGDTMPPPQRRVFSPGVGSGGVNDNNATTTTPVADAIPSLLPLEGFLLSVYMEVMSQRSPENGTTTAERKVAQLISAAKRKDVLAELQKRKLEQKKRTPETSCGGGRNDKDGGCLIQERDVAFCCKLAALLSIPVQILRTDGILPIQLVATEQGRRQGHLYCHTFGPTPQSALHKPFHPHWYTSPLSAACCHQGHTSSFPTHSPELIRVAAQFENVPLLRMSVRQNAACGTGVPWKDVFEGAVVANSTTVVSALLRWKASLAHQETNAINLAAANDSLQVLRKILRSPDALDCNGDDAPPLLMTCAFHDSHKCARFLVIDHHVAINRLTKKNTIVVDLPDLGSNVGGGSGRRMKRPAGSPVDAQGGLKKQRVEITPLWECVVYNSLETAQAFIAGGADFTGCGPHSLITLAFFCHAQPMARLLYNRALHRSKDQVLLSELENDIAEVAKWREESSAISRRPEFESFNKEAVLEWLIGDGGGQVAGSSTAPTDTAGGGLATAPAACSSVGGYQYQGTGANGEGLPHHRSKRIAGGGGGLGISAVELSRAQWLERYRRTATQYTLGVQEEQQHASSSSSDDGGQDDDAEGDE